MVFDQEILEQINEITTHYPAEHKKAALLPVLHAVQDRYTYLSVAVLDAVADLLQLKKIEVYEVATFYSMYWLEPHGKYVFEVCQTGPCMLKGCDHIISYISKTLNIKPGETTADGLFTLKTVECLGACGYAPMMQLGKNYCEHLTTDKIDKIIADCKKNAQS
ncbi:MAG: NAD(P)H-dependent oxidoreductase subunit E [Phycisphaerales bacterium]|nr:NAD(P)H-dependent oxidoreductase subunit E [Phycisphaerales bacterium]